MKKHWNLIMNLIIIATIAGRSLILEILVLRSQTTSYPRLLLYLCIVVCGGLNLALPSLSLLSQTLGIAELQCLICLFQIFISMQTLSSILSLQFVGQIYTFLQSSI